MIQANTGQGNAAPRVEMRARKPYQQPVLNKAAPLSAVTATATVSAPAKLPP